MRRVTSLAMGLVLLGLALFWALTMPQRGDADRMALLTGDVARGKTVFYAGGCASCHAAKGAEGDARLVLSGGLDFPTEFGTFFAPNISPDPVHGIGGWSAHEFADAMQNGVTPTGQHYYPAFPYTSYVHATDQDIADLFAFLRTLPASGIPNKPHDVSFPFNMRRGLGLWKLLYMADEWQQGSPNDAVAMRGRYLVEGLGHCAECHTPRTFLAGLDRAKWLQGTPSPNGEGKIPGLTPAQLDWSVEDIAYYLESGFTPDFDSAGGEMVDVIANTSKLSSEDRMAIATYLKALGP